jgi:hypothetical protein
MGASLVIWLLLYFVLRRMQTLVPTTGIDYLTADTVFISISGYASSLNFFYTHLFLMLLVPIPFLRKSWQIAALGIFVFIAIHIDRTAVAADADPFYNSMLTYVIIMAAVLVCFATGMRFLINPPAIDDKSVEALAMRRSGFFALGTIAVVMDNMIFRAIGFLAGTGKRMVDLPHCQLLWCHSRVQLCNGDVGRNDIYSRCLFLRHDCIWIGFNLPHHPIHPKETPS